MRRSGQRGENSWGATTRSIRMQAEWASTSSYGLDTLLEQRLSA